MKITLNSAHLLKKLQLLGGVINSNSTLPALENFLFDINNNEFKITACDLETTISSTIEIKSEIIISICVNAKMILDVLKTFTDQNIEIILSKDNTLEIKCKTRKYAIPYSDSKEFPKTPILAKTSTTTMPSKVLAKAIEKTLFATIDDALRPVFQGVLFQLSETGTTFVATDANKLSKYTRNDAKASQESEFVMPKKPLGILKNALGGAKEDVLITYNATNATFSFDDITIICRLIDGKYPNYEAVIPKENPNKLTINRVAFLTAIKNVCVFSSFQSISAAFEIKAKEIRIYNENIDYSCKADEVLECKYKGDDMTIGFNPKLLIDVLSHLDCEKIKMELSQPNRAGVITPKDGLIEGENELMLIMPVLLAK